MKKLNTEEFILRAKRVHGDIYDYSETAYVKNGLKVKIICKEHGPFLQTPNGHLNKRGCEYCGIFRRSVTQLMTQKDFIEKSKIVHGNKYDYAETVYVNSESKVDIICSIHGKFIQKANDHLNKHGCFQCGIENGHIKQIKDVEILIRQFVKVHNNYYDYNLIDYQGARVPVEIICPKHGSFWQTSNNHLNGGHCPKCGNNNVSKPEVWWLDSLNVPQEYRQKVVRIDDRKIKADACDSNNKIIYEFYGDFWHGNPRVFDPNDTNPLNKTTFGKLYADTLEKEKLIKKAGYQLISIWESDFKNNKKNINQVL
jgi:predicted nucleic-acid-binding Zn-ribbon protein